MKKQLLLLLSFIIIATISNPHESKAQSIKLLGQNTLNGAINGVLLGGATMALQNEDKFGPVRVGLGAGTLYGIGVGVYDMSRVDKGQQFYLSGTFNDATNSTIIPLLDTLYGAAGGAIIASSVSLILQEPFVEAIQYGAGAGAWIGFGFGLVDAFALAEGPNFAAQSSVGISSVDGLISYQNSSSSIGIGMLSPNLFAQKKLSTNSFTTSYQPSITVMNLSVNL